MNLTIAITCRTCKTQHQVDVTYTGWMKYNQGHLIQNCFPKLSLTDRELIISNTCGKCWDDMFKEEEHWDAVMPLYPYNTCASEDLSKTMRVTLPTLEGDAGMAFRVKIEMLDEKEQEDHDEYHLQIQLREIQQGL